MQFKRMPDRGDTQTETAGSCDPADIWFPDELKSLPI